MVLDLSSVWNPHFYLLALHFWRGAAIIPLKIFAVQFTNRKTYLYIARKLVQESAGFAFRLELGVCMLLNQLHYCGWFNYSIAHHVVEWIERLQLTWVVGWLWKALGFTQHGLCPLGYSYAFQQCEVGFLKASLALLFYASIFLV